MQAVAAAGKIAAHAACDRRWASRLTYTEDDARRWLNLQLDKVFPDADDLIQKMELIQTYKDVTFETLNRKEFLLLVQKAFSAVNWEKAYNEIRAAGEKTK